MEYWWVDEETKFKQGKISIPTYQFKIPYMMLISILSILYGEENSTHFHMEWIPMSYTVVKTRHVFNWAKILTFNIFHTTKSVQGIKKTCFYMSAYLMNAIFSSMQFPIFRWSWDRDQPPIHIYCFDLWNINYKKCFYNLCDSFLVPLHTIIFRLPRYRISNEAMDRMKDVA
jgi:hypothetical protein